MKRFILAAAVALLALPAAAQVQEAFPSYIQVNGRAEREIAPDEFYLQIVINERDSKGKVSVESQQRDMIAALKRLGFRPSNSPLIGEDGYAYNGYWENAQI